VKISKLLIHAHERTTLLPYGTTKKKCSNETTNLYEINQNLVSIRYLLSGAANNDVEQVAVAT